MILCQAFFHPKYFYIFSFIIKGVFGRSKDLFQGANKISNYETGRFSRVVWTKMLDFKNKDMGVS